MITYAGYNELMMNEEVKEGRDGEFTLRKFRFGDTGKRKQGCRDFSLVYPEDPILPTSLMPGETYKDITIGKTRTQSLPDGSIKPGRSRISADLHWKDSRNFILASSWDGFTYGGDGKILVPPDEKGNIRLEEYAIGSDGRSAADGTYEVALFSLAEGKGTFAIERSGDYGVDVYGVSGTEMSKRATTKEEVKDWISIASDEMRIETLKQKKEALENTIKGIETELSAYSEKDAELSETDNIVE